VTTARERFGIDSFVYSRRRPFSPERLERVLALLPTNAAAVLEGKTARQDDDDQVAAALGVLLRSKGFMWLASSTDAAYYWSHAGAFYDAPVLGRWWDTLPREYWPEDQAEAILSDFLGDDGDRRQEIVFIGVDAVDRRETIETALDACLLTDDEFDAYRAADGNPKRRELFPSTFFRHG